MGAPKDGLDATIQRCIDPSKSVVVTSCAGSGKTWLLTSRILRIIIMLDPECKHLHRILAITFTNNAAAEIANRVRSRLRDLAYGDEKDPDEDLEEYQSKKLQEIGIEKSPGDFNLRGIYRSFITQRPGISINTFHSWFNHLVQYLPWSERSNFHNRITENPEHLKRRAWEQMLANINDDKSDGAQAMHYLLGVYKLDTLRKYLVKVLDKRSEWYLHFDCAPEDVNTPESRDAFEVFQKKTDGGAPPKPEKIHTKQELKARFQDKLDRLVEALKDEAEPLKEKAHLKLAYNALNEGRQAGAGGFFNALRDKIAKSDTVLKAVKKNNPAYKGFDAVVEEMKKETEKVMASEAYLFNLHCARIATLYAQQYAKLKEQEGVVDYADLELVPLRALIKGTGKDKHGKVLAPRLQDLFKRLEDTYDHILIDEFQDTSPPQWRMLHAWLEQSAGKATVFIVGDPKQSIYSWRGGNPKLLGVARKYLKENYKGEAESINHTRRCSQQIVDAVNEVFSNEGEWALDGFEKHETLREKEQEEGASLVLCFQTEELKPGEESESKLRDPLEEKAQEQEEGDSRAKIEGEMLAEKIRGIKNKGYANKDILLLHPTRTNSAYLIETLAGEELSCSLFDRSSRMDCLECQDMLALLHAIFDPGYGLMVAQVLRSPIFGVSEEDLWKVYQTGLSQDGKYCNWAKGLDQAAGGSDKLQEAQRLIGSWRASYLEQKLPAHELLARCYQEADIIKSYVDAVPQDIAKRVILNLDWILNYSLETQGGRLVLPSEYAAHLRELSEAGEKTDLTAEGDKVIPSLTVHGAKGLESEVVIVVNSDYGIKSSGDPLLVTWDLDNLDDLRPNHISFCRGEKHATNLQAKAKNDLKEDRKQERNNLLYVAMTRARQHLFFSQRPFKNPARKGYYSKWWKRINDCLSNPDERKLDVLRFGETSSSANKTDSDKRRRWPDGESKPIKTGKRNEADNEFKIQGTQRHNLLALILQNEEAHEKIMDDNQILHRRLLGIGKDRLKELHGEIKRILAPETEFGALLAQVDKKKNPIECELSAIVDGEHKGQVKIRRIDCLLTTKDDVVWIIDFKTGGSAFEDEHKNEYDEQLRAYYSVVKGSHLKDKTIKMAIVDREGGMREVQPA